MIRCSEVDWAEEWREQYRKTMEVRGRTNYYQDSERARKYFETEHLWKDGQARVQDLHIEPTWTTIDIGSGPGIMTIPMAKRCSRVTAVEPSPFMLKHLCEKAGSEGLSNIFTIQSTWEEASGLQTHDVVVASYCLLMPDIKASLLKMNELATQHVHIFWFAGQTYWERTRMDLYPAIHGRSHAPGPKVDVLFNLLYNMGICPEIKVLDPFPAPEKVMTVEEALSDLRDLMELPDRSHDPLLEEYMLNNYKKSNGGYLRPDCTKRVRLSWKPRPLL